MLDVTITQAHDRLIVDNEAIAGGGLLYLSHDAVGGIEPGGVILPLPKEGNAVPAHFLRPVEGRIGVSERVDRQRGRHRGHANANRHVKRLASFQKEVIARGLAEPPGDLLPSVRRDAEEHGGELITPHAR